MKLHLSTDVDCSGFKYKILVVDSQTEALSESCSVADVEEAAMHWKICKCIRTSGGRCKYI